MFSPAVTHASFGRHTLVRLGTYDTHVSFVAGQAGYVHEVKLAGRELLENYPDGDALDANDGYRNLALVPFPNRLLEGEYEWGGRHLSFPVNMPDTRSALHGFGPDARFRIDRVELSARSAEARLLYLHTPGDHPHSYPFTVRFDLTLAIDLDGPQASWRLSATNLGADSAPVGLGWHPYFRLPGGHEAWRLRMPPNERVVLERAIPTGERVEGLPPKRALPIDTAWDDCFALTSAEWPGQSRTVLLEGPDYGIELAQTAATRYTQLYVPPGAASVAVEPMTCNVNAFAASPKEVTLAPGRTISTGLTMRLVEGANA